MTAPSNLQWTRQASDIRDLSKQLRSQRVYAVLAAKRAECIAAYTFVYAGGDYKVKVLICNMFTHVNCGELSSALQFPVWG